MDNIETNKEDNQPLTSENSIDKERLGREALQSKMISAAFGEVVNILMRSPNYKHYSLADLEWLVMPVVLNRQFLLAEARVKDKGFSTPVGVALWASVSEEVDKKLSENLSKPIHLRPDEWNSGEIFWLIDILGEPKIVEGLLQKLRETVFKEKSVKVRVINENGPEIKTLEATT